MNTLPIIFQAEFLRKARSRPFIIGTVIGMLCVAALVFVPTYLGKLFDTSTKSIVLAGDPALIARAKPLLAKDFDIVATPPAPASAPTIADLDRAQKAFAYVVIERRPAGLHATAYARDASTFSNRTFARDLVPLNIELVTHLAQSRIDPLLTVPVDIKGLDRKFATESASNSARAIAYVLVIFLYLAIMLNSQSVMASVAEEKTSRVAELLVATTSPMLLLAGKILAAAAIAAVQLAAWLGAGFLATQVVASKTAHTAATTATSSDFSGLGRLDLSTGIALAFIAFFILGFLQYVTLYAAAASLISRTEDLGSVAAPLVFPVLAAYLTAIFTLGFPNDPRVAILSEVPLLSPFVMFTRLTVSTVATWQIVLALVINVAATLLIIWAAGKIYRVGLLMYGRPPSIKQVITALRA